MANLTYNDIKGFYRSKEPITPEQIQEAIAGHVKLVQETAVTAATLSGEYHAKVKLLPFVEEGIQSTYYTAQDAHHKAMRHLSKLVYWYAKAQAGVLYEATQAVHAPAPYEPDEASFEDDEDGDTADIDDEDDEPEDYAKF